MYSRLDGRPSLREERSRAERRAERRSLEYSGDLTMGWAKVGLRIEWSGTWAVGRAGALGCRVTMWWNMGTAEGDDGLGGRRAGGIGVLLSSEKAPRNQM
jgi:hypothetical protein